MASKQKQVGYAAVAVPLADGCFSSYVYTKEHRESSGAGAGRTLFVVNVDDEGIVNQLYSFLNPPDAQFDAAPLHLPFTSAQTSFAALKHVFESSIINVERGCECNSCLSLFHAAGDGAP
jgi:hypothetical protein